ncbi:hypothetical protein CHCC15337_3562 [Bacillus paralicheniformis]|nr:hypothetical protein CHCC5021_3030 [Bacillus paralicheniformis]TWL11105.1 hypothetical protein CHCC19468_1939 [Bacillus paralicheniformis]TWL19853.1 hypothetical protein CHCC19467_0911 [Bacillus paralicheniformis]TWL45753.1 hypothetical protein CHCC15337_3562 [Bacillus paralicheniformis]TWL58395.1 hypothetical protein CHCC15332_1173 [Bacillus paralicheniformis]
MVRQLGDVFDFAKVSLNDRSDCISLHEKSRAIPARRG